MTADTDLHLLARSYLERLDGAARALPPDRASELVGDIADHLRQALSPDATEAEVRTVLDRLGTPQELVAAAGGHEPAPGGDGVPERGGREALALVMLVAAEILFVVWFVAIPMWVAGLVLMAISAAWSGREKLLGLLALGTGLPVALTTVSSLAFVTYESCSGTGQETVVGADGTVTTTPLEATCTTAGGSSTWLSVVAVVLLVAYLALQVWTLRRLTRRR